VVILCTTRFHIQNGSTILTSALGFIGGGGVVVLSGQGHFCLSFAPGLVGGCMGPKGGLEVLEMVLSGVEPWFPGRPARHPVVISTELQWLLTYVHCLFSTVAQNWRAELSALAARSGQARFEAVAVLAVGYLSDMWRCQRFGWVSASIVRSVQPQNVGMWM